MNIASANRLATAIATFDRHAKKYLELHPSVAFVPVPALAVALGFGIAKGDLSFVVTSHPVFAEVCAELGVRATGEALIAFVRGST
jgi:hypothetical protein